MLRIIYRSSSSSSSLFYRPITRFHLIPSRIYSTNNNHNNNNEKQPHEHSNKISLISGAVVGGSVILGKAKYLLAALKVTKMAPLVSMIITSGMYSLIFGWPYAVGMVGLVFCHECGHAAAMHRYNIPFSPMVFVPFMGAVIVMKDIPPNAYQEGVIALAGPVAGTAAAACIGVGGMILDSQLLLALADFGYMINLFNLLPVGSLDGGRVLGVVSPYFGLVGLAGGAGLIATGYVSNPIFYLIMLGGGYSTAQRIMGWGEDNARPKDYYTRVTPNHQRTLFGAYFALVATLLGAMHLNNQHRKTPKQIQSNGYDTHDFSEELMLDRNTIDRRDPFKGDGVYDDYFEELSKSWDGGRRM